MNIPTDSLGIHVEYIKLDGVLATKAQTTIHKSPNRNNKYCADEGNVIKCNRGSVGGWEKFEVGKI